MLAAVLFGLAILTLPAALALLWALDRGSVTLVSAFAVATVGAGVLIMHGGIALAARRWRVRGPELFAAIVPAR